MSPTLAPPSLTSTPTPTLSSPWPGRPHPLPCDAPTPTSTSPTSTPTPTLQLLVTGASSGIGRDFCPNLARAGCRIVTAACRADWLRSLCDEINAAAAAHAPRTVAVELDVAVLPLPRRQPIPDPRRLQIRRQSDLFAVDGPSQIRTEH